MDPRIEALVWVGFFILIAGFVVAVLYLIDKLSDKWPCLMFVLLVVTVLLLAYWFAFSVLAGG